MDDVTVGLIGLGFLLALLLIGTPIAISLIVVSFLGTWQLTNLKVAWGFLKFLPYSFSANWILSSIPLFLLLGFICYYAELTKGMFNAARVWLARLPGGLAISAVVGSAGFATVSGSSLATSAAMGRIAIPEMLENNYDQRLATGVVAISGTIGALIPPSIILIVYGLIAEQSITELFLGGLTVGIITAVLYAFVVVIYSLLNPQSARGVKTDTTFREKVSALIETWPALLIIASVFIGLFSGVFTATESGAVAVAIAIVAGVARRTLTWAGLWNACKDAASVTCSIIFIAVGASLLSKFLAISGVDEFLSDALLSFSSNEIVAFLIIVSIYLFLGMFIDPIGAMLLTLPFVLPFVREIGWSAVWFGVVLTKLLEIGMITPPVGMNVFIVKSVVKDTVPLGDIFRGVMWFFIVDMIFIFTLAMFPNIVLFLPNML